MDPRAPGVDTHEEWKGMAQPVGLVVEPVVLNRLGVFPESATTVLASQVSETEACSALVPVTPEALLRLVLDLESAQESSVPRTACSAGAHRCWVPYGVGAIGQEAGAAAGAHGAGCS